MKIKLFLIVIFSLSTLIAYSQDSTWQKISLNNNECVLFMPKQATVKDTVVVRNGLATHVEVHSFTSDELELAMVSTEVMKRGDKNENAGKEVMNGFRKGMEKKAMSMGLTVVIRDTILAGKTCNIGVIKGPLATLYAYAVLHGRFFYVFTRTLVFPTDKSQADVKKFMNSISFSKEEPETSSTYSSYRTSTAYRIGRIFGMLLVPAIIIVLIFVFAKGRNKNKVS